MAQEYKIGISGRFQKDAVLELFGYGSINIDVAGKNYVKVTQNIGTTDETIPLGDIGTIGHVFVCNHDATNYLLVGADGTNYPIKVPPADQIVAGWNGAAVHIKAHTAACDAEIFVLEA